MPPKHAARRSKGETAGRGEYNARQSRVPLSFSSYGRFFWVEVRFYSAGHMTWEKNASSLSCSLGCTRVNSRPNAIWSGGRGVT